MFFETQHGGLCTGTLSPISQNYVTALEFLTLFIDALYSGQVDLIQDSHFTSGKPAPVIQFT